MLTKQSRADRKEAFRKIGEAISKRADSPTAFNPHYDIKPRRVQSAALKSMKTLQWEPTTR